MKWLWLKILQLNLSIAISLKKLMDFTHYPCIYLANLNYIIKVIIKNIMERRRWNFAEILIKKVSILMAILISRLVKSNKKKSIKPDCQKGVGGN